MISLIIPVLNETDDFLTMLLSLQKNRSKDLEIIIIDGGSENLMLDVIAPLCDIIEVTTKGRARQMNLGASRASGNILLFLHADTILPEDFICIIKNKLSGQQNTWGRFDVTLSGTAASFRLIEFLINLRSRWTGIATGDQAIFTNAEVFQQVGGYPDIPLMEDVAFSKKLKKTTSPPVCLTERVTTSSRRWETQGIWRTIFLMWRLRLSYFFGADPRQLAAKYE